MKDNPNSIMFDVDGFKWITSQEYNDDLHQQSLERSRKIGREIGKQRELLLLNVINGAGVMLPGREIVIPRPR